MGSVVGADSGVCVVVGCLDFREGAYRLGIGIGGGKAYHIRVAGAANPDPTSLAYISENMRTGLVGVAAVGHVDCALAGEVARKPEGAVARTLPEQAYEGLQIVSGKLDDVAARALAATWVMALSGGKILAQAVNGGGVVVAVHDTLAPPKTDIANRLRVYVPEHGFMSLHDANNMEAERLNVEGVNMSFKDIALMSNANKPHIATVNVQQIDPGEFARMCIEEAKRALRAAPRHRPTAAAAQQCACGAPG